jgi:hypothetical protein
MLTVFLCGSLFIVEASNLHVILPQVGADFEHHLAQVNYRFKSRTWEDFRLMDCTYCCNLGVVYSLSECQKLFLGHLCRSITQHPRSILISCQLQHYSTSTLQLKVQHLMPLAVGQAVMVSLNFTYSVLFYPLRQ